MEKLQKVSLVGCSNRGGGMEAIYGELRFLGASFLWGMLLLFAYDGFIIGRNCIPHKKWVIAFEDFLFWILAGCSAFMVMYKMNHGVIRAFSVAAILTGMLVYHFTISRCFVKWFTKGIKKTERGIAKIVKWVLTPFIWIGKRVFWTFQWLGKKGKRFIRFCIKGLKKIVKKVKIVSTKQ